MNGLPALSSPSPALDSPRVALVNMPFHAYYAPSIALGILKAELMQRGIPARVYELTFELLPFIDPDDPARGGEIFRFLADRWHLGLGEWLFSSPMEAEAEARHFDWVRRRWRRLAAYGEPEEIIASLRRAAPLFIDRMARRITGAGHDVVGFTTTYFQTQASVHLARRIKELAPSTRIMVGGASTTDVMGVAMLKAFPVIDLVCHTEAEEIIAPIVRALRGEPGFSLGEIGGISYRTATGAVVDRSKIEAPLPRMDDVLLPDYDDYFVDAAAFVERAGGRMQLPLQLPVETSRGCWWGEKSHCTFCGLNSNRMRFRGRSPENAAESLLALYRRYRFPSFFAVDTIIDHRYFDSFCRILAEAKEPIQLSYEVKANLKKPEIQALASAGVTWVQPGLESLSTPVLQKLMKKGTSAIQNVQALKWFAEHGIRVSWNLFPTYPGDRLADYEHVPDLLRRLRHLPAPNYNPLQVQRFSPQHNEPEAHGLRILGVHAGWKLAFHDVAPDVLMDLTYMFEWDEPGRDVAVDELAKTRIRPLVEAWKKHQAEEGCTLSVLHGPRQSAVIHGRLEAPRRIVRYSGAAASILRACGAHRPQAKLLEALAQGDSELPWESEEESLDQGNYDFFLDRWRKAGVPLEEAGLAGPHAAIVESLVGEGLLMREEGRILTLAVNCFRSVHREILARDSMTFFAYLTAPSTGPAAVAAKVPGVATEAATLAPATAPGDLIPAASLIRARATITGRDRPPWYYRQNGFSSLAAMSDAHAQVARAAHALLSGRRARVIDLGCGNGALLARLCEENPGTIAYGVDRDPGKIERAREIHGNYPENFVAGSAFDFSGWWPADWDFDVMILCPGRFLEAPAAEAEALRRRIAEKVDRVLLYAYSDWLASYGSVEAIAHLTGFEILDSSPDKAVRVGRPR